MNKTVKIGWWSAGITSAIGCKIACEIYTDVQLYYIETGAAHEDNHRFKKECEQWYGQEIITVQNTAGYKDHIDVILKDRYVNGPDGAKCTKELKKAVRYQVEDSFALTLFNSTILTNQVFGFEFSKKEVNRAIRFMEQHPAANALFPLIERGITKPNAFAMLAAAGIEPPAMYQWFDNNNCIGCTKGGKAYWNKTREVFPSWFNRMAAAERVVGHSCINGVFLDELKPGTGRSKKPVAPDCGNFCEIEFADIPHASLHSVMAGQVSIYDVLKKAI